MLSDDLCPKPVNIRGEKCSWTMHSQPMPPTTFSNFFFRFLGFLFYMTCGIHLSKLSHASLDEWVALVKFTVNSSFVQITRIPKYLRHCAI
jgi:hypothetical protein